MPSTNRIVRLYSCVRDLYSWTVLLNLYLRCLMSIASGGHPLSVVAPASPRLAAL